MNNKVKKTFAGVQKVVALALCVAGVLFPVASGCGKQERDTSGDMALLRDASAEASDDAYLDACNFSSSAGVALNCGILSFFEGLSDCSDCSDVYLVGGLVLDKIKYGLNIQLVSDLKGNFPKNADPFIIWGADDAFDYVSIELNRFDQLAGYKSGDVLIMQLIQVRDLSEHTLFEKQGDYSTLTCTCSVLKLSDGRVTGYLTPVDGFNYKEQSMSWEAFINELSKSINQITNK